MTPSKDADIALYHDWGSSASRRVRFTLAEKNLAFESRIVDVGKHEHHTEAYKQIHPGGVIPAMVHQGRIIREATLITEYLEEVFPEIPLMPSDPWLRARTREWGKLVDEIYLPALLVQNWVRWVRPRVRQWSDQELAERLAAVPTPQRRDILRRMAREPYSAEEIEKKLEDLRDGVRRMEAALQVGPWLMGQMFTLADINMSPYVTRVVDLDRPFVDANPRVADWWERVTARPAFSVARITASPAAEIVL